MLIKLNFLDRFSNFRK